MDVNNIEEISVKLSNGDNIIYKGRGIEKFRRIMAKCPPLGSSQESPVTVIESLSDDEIPQKKGSKGMNMPPTTGSYATANLQYSAPSKGKSAIDIAREMQQHAEKISGIKF